MMTAIHPLLHPYYTESICIWCKKTLYVVSDANLSDITVHWKTHCKMSTYMFVSVVSVLANNCENFIELSRRRYCTPSHFRYIFIVTTQRDVWLFENSKWKNSALIGALNWVSRLLCCKTQNKLVLLFHFLLDITKGPDEWYWIILFHNSVVPGMLSHCVEIRCPC